MSDKKIVVEIHGRADGSEVYRWHCPSCPFIVSASSDDAVKTGRAEHLAYDALRTTSPSVVEC